jgi:hypothetical protein
MRSELATVAPTAAIHPSAFTIHTLIAPFAADRTNPKSKTQSEYP